MFRWIKNRSVKFKIASILTLGLIAYCGNVVRVMLFGRGTVPGVPINTLSFSPDDKYLVVASSAYSTDSDPEEKFKWYNGGCRIFDVATKSVYASLPYGSPLNPETGAQASYSQRGRKPQQIQGPMVRSKTGARFSCELTTLRSGVRQAFGKAVY